METSLITTYKEEIDHQLTDKETMDSLLVTTFKGLEPQMMKRAMLEGMMRGFSFKDFLEKNIYAVPFAGSYSLITSIDYARKVGMKNGVIGKSAPEFVVDEITKKPVSCTITIKRKVDGEIGEYTDTAFFAEYSTGKNLWASKPFTMIAKVAEMHALRMACPEELSQAYVAEERERDGVHENVVDITDYSDQEATIRSVKSLDELKKVWADMAPAAKKALKEAQAEMKAILTTESHENA